MESTLVAHKRVSKNITYVLAGKRGNDSVTLESSLLVNTSSTNTSSPGNVLVHFGKWELHEKDKSRMLVEVVRNAGVKERSKSRDVLQS